MEFPPRTGTCILPLTYQTNKQMRSPIGTSRQVNSNTSDQGTRQVRLNTSDQIRAPGKWMTDPPNRRVNGAVTTADEGDYSHEEGCGEHEAYGYHDDGQRRVPLHRHGARDRLRRLRHESPGSAQRAPKQNPGSTQEKAVEGSPSREIWWHCSRRPLCLPRRLLVAAAMRRLKDLWRPRSQMDPSGTMAINRALAWVLVGFGSEWWAGPWLRTGKKKNGLVTFMASPTSLITDQKVLRPSEKKKCDPVFQTCLKKHVNVSWR